MKFVLLCVLVVAAGCATTHNSVHQTDPETVRDVESYAIASCLYNQQQPLLKDQGDAWASVIVQRTKIEIESLNSVAEKVKVESEKSGVAVIRDETGQGKDKFVPVLYCYEIINRPAVRAAIQKAISAQ